MIIKYNKAPCLVLEIWELKNKENRQDRKLLGDMIYIVIYKNTKSIIWSYYHLTNLDEFSNDFLEFLIKDHINGNEYFYERINRL